MAPPPEHYFWSSNPNVHPILEVLYANQHFGYLRDLAFDFSSWHNAVQNSHFDFFRGPVCTCVMRGFYLPPNTKHPIGTMLILVPIFCLRSWLITV